MFSVYFVVDATKSLDGLKTAPALSPHRVSGALNPFF